MVSRSELLLDIAKIPARSTYMLQRQEREVEFDPGFY